MKIFLSGGNGMVGTNLRKTLEESSHYEVLAPNKNTLNLLDKLKLKEYFLEEKPDMVIHCAGIVGGIKMNIQNQAKSLEENTLMAMNLISVSKETGVTKFLNLGSSCMYPKDLEKELKISDLLTNLLEPTNEGYALAKIFAWKYLNFMSDQSFIGKTAIPCNLFGEYDKFDEGRSHLLPAIIRKVKESKENGTQIEIWGDGSARREFMYVGDFVKIILIVIEKFDTFPREFNLGCETDYTILEYYKKVCEVLDAKQDFKFKLDEPTGMRRKKLDISFQKAFNLEYSFELCKGIRNTYKFFMENYG